MITRWFLIWFCLVLNNQRRSGRRGKQKRNEVCNAQVGGCISYFTLWVVAVFYLKWQQVHVWKLHCEKHTEVLRGRDCDNYLKGGSENTTMRWQSGLQFLLQKVRVNKPCCTYEANFETYNPVYCIHYKTQTSSGWHSGIWVAAQGRFGSVCRVACTQGLLQEWNRSKDTTVSTWQPKIKRFICLRVSTAPKNFKDLA